MKSLLTRFAPTVMIVALAAGSGIALTTLAHAQGATAAPAAPRPPHSPQGWGGPGHERGGRMMKEVERLKTSLKLTASQAALWDRAADLMKPPADAREKIRSQRDRVAAMLDDPAFDPRRLAAEMDGAQSERRARMASVRDAWFAVYDSLNPVQRGQAREFLRSHLTMHRGHGGREGWMHRHDEGRSGPPAPR